MNTISIRKISLSDGEKERQFLLTVPKEENGFHNKASQEELSTPDAFRTWVAQKVAHSLGNDLKPGYVPSSIYYIELNGEIVGLADLRHHLNDFLIKDAGGHIGIGGIKREYRGKGIGSQAMKLLIDELVSMGEKDILLGAHEDNIASRKMIESNGGVLEKIIPATDNTGQATAVYWIHR